MKKIYYIVIIIVLIFLGCNPNEGSQIDNQNHGSEVNIPINIYTQLVNTTPLKNSRALLADRDDYNWMTMTQAHFGLFAVTIGSISNLVEDPISREEAIAFGATLNADSGLLFTPQGTNLELQLVSPLEDVPTIIDLIVLDIRGTYNPDGTVGFNNQYYIPELTNNPDYIYDYMGSFSIEDATTNVATTSQGLRIEYIVFVDENILSAPFVFNKYPKPIDEIWTWIEMSDSMFNPLPSAEQLYGTEAYDWPAPTPVDLNPNYHDLDILSAQEKNIIATIAKQLDDIWGMSLWQAQQRLNGDEILIEDQYRGATLYIPFTPITFNNPDSLTFEISWDISNLAYTIPGQTEYNIPKLFFIERGVYKTPFDWNIAIY